MGAHALLPPSGASRWLACPPSARWESTFPEIVNDAASEGTLAHRLCELLLLNTLKKIKQIEFNRELKKVKHNFLYTAEMNGYCVDYVAFITDKIHELHDPFIFVEEKIDLTEFVPEGFGTGDCILIADGILDINDLKYGKGVLVEAHENKQLMLYALGALRKYHLLYHIDKVRMTIYQPRLDNYSSFEVAAEWLLQWGDEIVKPIAALAFAGKGEYKAGSHCKFCKAKNECKTLADYQMDVAKYAFEDPFRLSDKAIAEILDKAPDLKVWLTNIQTYALQEAVHNDKQWPGFKLVAGKSIRKYLDEAAIQKDLKKAKIHSNLYLTKPGLVGITTLEKNIGKSEVDRIVGKHIAKPPGAATLVPEWDKRPALNSADAAKVAFENVETNS